MSAPEGKEQRDRLISSLNKSQQYLTKQVATIPNYQILLDKLNSKLDLLQTQEQLIVKIISSEPDLALTLKNQSENQEQLRSRYSFQVIDSLDNVPQILDNCGLICLLFPSLGNITDNYLLLIEAAEEKQIDLLLGIVNREHKVNQNLSDWLTSRVPQSNPALFLGFDDFIDLHSPNFSQDYQQLLIQNLPLIHHHFTTAHLKIIKSMIQDFFQQEKQCLWGDIKQIKAEYLLEKDIHDYRQNQLNKIFNQINSSQQQVWQDIKQKVHQSRQQYLNPFCSNSWMFQLERIIESSQVKIVPEIEDKYLYLVINNQEQTEYVYSHVLGLYQTIIDRELKSQWQRMTKENQTSELQELLRELNAKIQNLSLLKKEAIAEVSLNQQTELLPQLDLNKFIDLSCLKINSRVVFDYDYTKSSWFRLGIYLLMGCGIYWITKLYFGEGRYIGFLIIVFQLVNLIVGQDPKKMRLKQQEKELKRITNQKYQNLLRLMVEQLIQTLINTLEIQRKHIKQQIDAIADLANNKLDQIQQNIEQKRATIDTLEKDRQQIQSWFN